MIIPFFLFVFCVCFTCFFLKAQDARIAHLKTEYAETPLRIDVEKPRFSWQMQADKGGYYQTAYQIIVRDESNQKI